MDSITFGTPVLLRHLTFSEARKEPIKEYHYGQVLEGLGMSPDQVRPARLWGTLSMCVRGTGAQIPRIGSKPRTYTMHTRAHTHPPSRLCACLSVCLSVASVVLISGGGVWAVYRLVHFAGL
jgi:hypothetical protein